MYSAAGIFYRVPPQWRWLAGMVITFFGAGWNIGQVLVVVLL
jgi:hypothetical protein